MPEKARQNPRRHPANRATPKKPKKPKRRKERKKPPPMASRKAAAAAKPALKKPGRNTANQSQAAKRTRYLRAEQIYSGLQAAYPDAKCALDHSNPLQLLIATILSAQSTDKMINTITPALFKKYKTAEDFANADTAELEQMIHSSGFFRNKARSIKAPAQTIAAQHGGTVPQTMEELLELQGVARKTAN